jgi:hypothetical protein
LLKNIIPWIIILPLKVCCGWRDGQIHAGMMKSKPSEECVWVLLFQKNEWAGFILPGWGKANQLL